MMESISFKTRARTLDHLGREQIADCPTAISELWKNAYDAYARSVFLDIFDSKNPVAVMTDDGHGMSMQEFQDRWLVIGTESKASSITIPKADRNGLPKRVKQGQKGIGRLSCANLGPILFIISKRKGFPFVASLIDWRLFENPYINLSDISVPTTEVETLTDVFNALPELIKGVVSNILRDKSKGNAESVRLVEAWRDFDRLPDRVNGENSEAIISAIQSANFGIDHLKDWSVCSGESTHGTALMVAGINYDLRAQLAERPFNPAIERTRKNFFETLTSFVDPYIDPDDVVIRNSAQNFRYAVRAFKKSNPSLIVGKDNAFSRRQIEDLEHCINGRVDEEGVFRGEVKAFGKWLPDKCVIYPPPDLPIPNRSNTKVGPFDVFISSMEFVFGNSTHDKVRHDLYKELAKKYAGFMIFRDGLRVLPYGRTDNDFFEIESRRSKSVGREFWNHRQMFGRIAITRELNPNLIDKAGREGLLDNRAAKGLKGVVDNLLMQSARKYFGNSSSYRKESLPEIQDSKAKLKDAEERKKLRDRNKRTFVSRLKKELDILPTLIGEIRATAKTLSIQTDNDVNNAQDKLAQLRTKLPSATLPGAPRSMSKRQKENYSTYRSDTAKARTLYDALRLSFEKKVEQFQPTNSFAVLEKQIEKSNRRVTTQINEWKKEVATLQKAEFNRVNSLANQRKSIFKDEATAIMQLFKVERETFASATKKLDVLQKSIEEENEAIFEPYIRVLESLQESIDIEHLATTGMEDLADARYELDRLNSLAQLGIAVEITGHDLQDFDDIIASGLNGLPKELQDTKPVRDIRVGYEGLTDQLRFLSPLRTAGVKIERWVEGQEIYKYIHEFFAPTLTRNKIKFTAESKFLNMRVFDQPSRLFPVFINLVNNSIYWLGTSNKDDLKIILGVIDDSVVVSDNGPGVDPGDVESLFQLFFTKKIQGGRGVGLYLCRANLTAGGHRIEYASKGENFPLAGANFLIKFKGAEFQNE